MSSINKPYLILFVGILTLLSCKKEMIETTGSISIRFQNGIPASVALYTESGFANYHVPLFSTGGRAGGITVRTSDQTITFEGLNEGNYVLQTSSPTGILVVQCTAGEERSYTF